MYGKIFDLIYDGTLYGHWEAIVTFQQMIVLADADGIVDMTPQAICARTSIPIELLEKGLKKLAEPDPYSRTPGEDGRRIVCIDEHRPWGWQIVNYLKYKHLKDSNEVREQNRIRAQKFRDKRNGSNAASRGVTLSNDKSRHTDTDTDTDITAKFGRFWDLYPKKTAKQDALKALLKLRPDGELFAKMLGALEAWKGSAAWLQESGKFIPHPATWINGRRWEDELPPVPDKKVAMA